MDDKAANIMANIIARRATEMEKEALDVITGPQGPRGERGIQGPIGPVGPTGLKGDRGPAGEKAERGERGPVGEAGPIGPTGPAGAKGDRGLTGPAGEDGKHGRDGRDAQVPEFVIGEAVVGTEAKATLHRNESGVYILSLILPRGERGVKGEPGPTGLRGFPGKDSVTPGPKGDPGKSITGPAGADSTVPGPQGIPGKDGLSIDEIKQLVVDILSDAGLLSEQAQKLATIRALLKKAIHQADARHAFQISEIIREVDKLF